MLQHQRYYPKPAYPWLYFREKVLQGGKPISCHELEHIVDNDRYSKFPDALRGKAAWWKVKACMKRFHKVLCDASSPFQVRMVDGMGLGVFATRRIVPGKQRSRLFGFLHRLSHKRASKLDALADRSVIQFRRKVLGKKRSVAKKRRRVTNRLELYYMGGPAALLNHACISHNAEWRIHDDRGPRGEFFVQVTREIQCGEEILVDYGPEFWSNNSDERCLCQDCNNVYS